MIFHVGHLISVNHSSDLEDHLGSSNLQLGADGSLVSKEEYYPFGETSFGSYGKKRYRFCGKEKDQESGLYYYGLRYYNPWTCRFINLDPLAAKYPFYTPYQYAGNKPINATDLDGAEEDKKVDTGGQANNNANIGKKQAGGINTGKMGVKAGGGTASTEESTNSTSTISSKTLLHPVKFSSSSGEFKYANIKFTPTNSTSTASSQSGAWNYNLTASIEGNNNYNSTEWEPLDKKTLQEYYQQNHCQTCNPGLLQNKVGNAFEDVWHRWAQSNLPAQYSYRPNRTKIFGESRNTVPDGFADAMGRSGWLTEGSWYEVKAKSGNLYESSNTYQVSAMIKALGAKYGMERGRAVFNLVTTSNVGATSLIGLAASNNLNFIQYKAYYRLWYGIMQVNFSFTHLGIEYGPYEQSVPATLR